MPQKHIDFRELLERVLPLEALAPADRRQVQQALQTGVAQQIEQAALLAIAQLERKGEVRRLPAAGNPFDGSVRYQPREGLDVITLQLPPATRRDGVDIVPRASLPTQAQTALHQVRGLLRLDEPLFSSDPRTGDPRAALFEHLDQIGRELLGARELRFVPSTAGGVAVTPLSPDWVAEVAAHPDLIYYCPNVSHSDAFRGPALTAGVRSVAMVAVARGEGGPLGVLEVHAAEADAYTPEALALVALVADCCATALERASRIERLVFVDPLTSAYNRPYLDLQLRNEMARAQREGASLALCIVDIDDFKSFNTTFGYEAGNQVLVQVARALRSGVRPFDAVCRWGGEEFAVLLTPPVHIHDVRTISERLRRLVEHQVVRIQALDGQLHRVVVTVSIGVAVYPQHETTTTALWRAANQALLQAKRPPKNQVVFYSPPETPAPR